MCSRVRGPAIAPSLVTWPTRTMGTPVSLATVSSRATRLADVAGAARRAGRVGRVDRLHRSRRPPAAAGRSSIAADDRVEVGLGEHGHRRQAAAQPLGAHRHLHRRLLAGAVQHRVDPARPMRAASCSARVDLPIPGSPPSRISEPATTPPPSTRSSSSMPVGGAGRRRRRRCRAAARSAAATRLGAARCRRDDRPLARRVFQAPQPSQRPCHFGVAAPQSEQTYWRRGRAGGGHRHRRCEHLFAAL